MVSYWLAQILASRKSTNVTTQQTEKTSVIMHYTLFVHITPYSGFYVRVNMTFTNISTKLLCFHLTIF